MSGREAAVVAGLSVVGLRLREVDYWKDGAVFGRKGRRLKMTTAEWEALGRPDMVRVEVTAMPSSALDTPAAEPSTTDTLRAIADEGADRARGRL